jgi:hypothetical protein
VGQLLSQSRDLEVDPPATAGGTDTDSIQSSKSGSLLP